VNPKSILLDVTLHKFFCFPRERQKGDKTATKSNLVCEDASSEGVEPEVPDGHDCGMLQDVSAIQEQKDASVKSF
jgi:hypothetical protein